MRMAILSDIHGNWTALRAVIGRLDDLNPDLIIGAGDYLWTTTGDRRVVDWLQQTTNGYFVRGNGDSLEYYERCKHLAHSDPREIYEAVAALPERLTLDLNGYRILVQHEWWPGGKFLGPELRERITAPPFVSDQVDLSGIDIAIFGDSHLPLQHATPASLIVHPGSVGAPFDDDPTQAKIATLDLGPDGVWLEHHAVPFDIDAANREIIEGRAIDINHSYYRKIDGNPANSGRRCLLGPCPATRPLDPPMMK